MSDDIEHREHNFDIYGGSCLIDEDSREYLSQYFWMQSGDGFAVRLTVTGFIVPMGIQILCGPGGPNEDPDPCAPWNHPDAVVRVLYADQVVGVPGYPAREQVAHLTDLVEPWTCSHSGRRQDLPRQRTKRRRR